MSGTKYLDQFDIDILKAIEIIDKENISGLTRTRQSDPKIFKRNPRVGILSIL